MAKIRERNSKVALQILEQYNHVGWSFFQSFTTSVAGTGIENK